MHIAFSATDSYADYLGTTIYSIIQHHPNQELHFYVLTKWMSDHSRFKLNRLTSQLVTISFIEIDSTSFDHLPLKEGISLETYFRILLPSQLAELDRVLYLDCDILVNGSLKEIWESDLSHHYLAGVNELDMLHSNAEYRQKIGFTPQDIYVNAGVLLFNLELMRQDKIEEFLFAKAQEIKNYIEYQDQDIINIGLKGQILNLEAKYNMTAYQRKVKHISLEEAVIIHFNWHKPWRKDQNYLQYNRESFELYRRTFQAYLSTVEPAVTLLVNAWQTRPASLSQCLASVFEQDYKNLQILLLLPEDQPELEEILIPYLTKEHPVMVIKKDFATKMEAYYAGLAHVKTSYFSMIEAEDWLDKTHISSLYHQLVEQDTFIASAPFTLLEEEEGIYKMFEPDLADGHRQTSYLLENLFGLKWYETFRHTHLDGKLYHSTIIQRAGQLASYHSEDLLACLFYLVGESVAFVNNRTYVKRNVSIVQPTFETEGGILQRMKELNHFASYIALCNLSLIHYKEFYKQELYDLLVTAQKLEKEELASKLEAKLNELQFLEQLPHHKPFY
ncbi:glycosyltransferase [Streptococcus suis]|uniref:glycosyltransferase family 8 protein n=1 Tax=Streptococcus suis TaxID=1307 RepID=UPI0017856A1C|nr:glycosyltransferase [Streptococcus suis]MBY4975708.1 glycosyltransferase [Streptococcus suis]QOZ88643.1 glycosyltransferase [Streptococcus suis]HEP1785961.1 glycosyltransferase [Streptococcus suis]